MAEALHPLAPPHLPGFIVAPGETDPLFGLVVVMVVALLFGIGTFYFWLHALPEHIAHRRNKLQMEIVAVLSVLALFTHEHLYWIAALLLAMIRIPDFLSPLARAAAALETLAGLAAPAAAPGTARAPEVLAAPAAPAAPHA